MANTAFQNAVKREEEYLRRVHPTPEDIPGCMNLFDVYLSCNGQQTLVYIHNLLKCMFFSHTNASEVPISVRTDVFLRRQARGLQILLDYEDDAPGREARRVDTA